MSQAAIWWVIAGLVVAIELVTGTFYLLMLAVGFVSAAIAAHLGASVPLQLVVAAFFGGTFVMAWRAYRKRQPPTRPANANADVNMDVGQTVRVDAWRPDGTTSVKYRGANWSVARSGNGPLLPGTHRIVAVVGNCLMVEHHEPEFKSVDN